jgi:hypothetical protein
VVLAEEKCEEKLEYGHKILKLEVFLVSLVYIGRLRIWRYI